LEAEQARALSAVERNAAERAKATANVAREEAASSYDYVRSILRQLRNAQAKPSRADVVGTTLKIGAMNDEDSETAVE
jgi:hypothetical protein